MNRMKVWFIWTWFIWGNMSQNFIERGFDVIKYNNKELIGNKDKLSECNIVFLAVPTPTINWKFDSSILDDAVKATSAGQKVIIKSTVIVWTTEKLQEKYQDRYFFHSAEFLTEKNAKYDGDYPSRNIVWYTKESKQFATEILSILPKSDNNVICKAAESEMWKYMSNFLLTAKVIMSNIIYDICNHNDINYNEVKNIAAIDKRIWDSHMNIEDDGWRWANWHCFPKDLAVVTEMYPDWFSGQYLLDFMEEYNIDLCYKSGKQMDIINKVYWLSNTL